MKIQRLPLLITVMILGSLLLSACGGTPVNSWPGVTASQNIIYLAYQGEVYAINAENGTLAWKFPSKPDASKPFYAAPAVSEDLIVAGNYGHMLYGISLSGAQVWEFDAKVGNFAGSPVIVGDTVLAPSSNGNLYALDKNGSPLWEFNTGNPLWTTPVSDGTIAYLPALDHNFYAINLADGKQVWKTDLKSALTSAPVLAEDGTLYASTLEGSVVALDSADGSVLWTTNTNGQLWATPLLHEEMLYVGNAANKVTAISVADGSIAWQKDADGPMIGGGVLMEDGVAFATEVGSLIAWSLDGQSQLWTQPVGGKLYTTPVVAGDTAVVAVTEGDKLLQALNTSGQLTWTFVQPK